MIEFHHHNKIKHILSDRFLPNHQKIELLKPLFQGINTIDINTIELIDLCFKGVYGSEYLVIEDNYQITVEFYQFLQAKFPVVHEIKLSLADLLLLGSQYEDGLNMFNQAFFEKPLLIFAAPSDLLDRLEKYGSDRQKIYYYFSLVRAFVEDANIEDALELYQEIRQRYGANNNYILDYLEKCNLSAILEKAQENR